MDLNIAFKIITNLFPDSPSPHVLLCPSCIPDKPVFFPRRYQAFFYLRTFIFSSFNSYTLNLQSASVFLLIPLSKGASPPQREFPDFPAAGPVPCHLPAILSHITHLIFFMIAHLVALHSTDLVIYLCIYFFFSPYYILTT